MTDDLASPSPDAYLQELMRAEAGQIQLDARRMEEEIRLEAIRRQQAQAARAEAGLAQLRTLALEFDTTLQRCDRLRAEVDAFLLPREGINHAELAERLESVLEPVSNWLADWDLQPEAVRRGMADWTHQALATLNLRNAQTVLDQCRQKLRETLAAAELIAKENAKNQAEELRSKAKAEQQRRELELQQAQVEQQKSELAGKYLATLKTLVTRVGVYIEEGEQALWPDQLKNKGSWSYRHPDVAQGLETLSAFKSGLLNLPPVPETTAQRQELLVRIRELERLRGLWSKYENYWAIGWDMNMSVHCMLREFPSHAPSALYFDETGREWRRENSYFLFHHPRIYEGFKQLLVLARQLPIVDEAP